jgi:RNA-binding protein
MSERVEKKPSPRPSRPLDGKQRRHLRGLAHALDPVVQIGKEGIDERVVGAVREALRAHELIKVRVLESAPLGKDEAGEQLSLEAGAYVVGKVGRIVMLYRMHEEKPKIVLPKTTRDD